MAIESMLCQGMESKKGLDILIGMTKIKSKPVINALYMHFNEGVNKKDAAEANGLTDGNLSRDIKKINARAVEINNYFEINYTRMMPVNE